MRATLTQVSMSARKPITKLCHFRVTIWLYLINITLVDVDRLFREHRRVSNSPHKTCEKAVSEVCLCKCLSNIVHDAHPKEIKHCGHAILLALTVSCSKCYRHLTVVQTRQKLCHSRQIRFCKHLLKIPLHLVSVHKGYLAVTVA